MSKGTKSFLLVVLIVNVLFCLSEYGTWLNALAAGGLAAVLYSAWLYGKFAQ